MQTNRPTYQKTAFILIGLVAIISILCVIWIWFDTGKESEQKTAHIYQDGNLIQSIDLSSVTESYRFTVTGEGNCRNEIEVRPGGIGIISADCPDKLCVHQGFIDSSQLPITCLPNRLVILIQTHDSTPNTEPTLDITSY